MDIASRVRAYVQAEEELAALRKRVRADKEEIMQWMLENLPVDERLINLPDSSLSIAEQKKLESTAKKAASAKIERFFESNGLDAALAAELIAEIYEKRAVLEEKQVLRRRKKRARKAKQEAAEE